MNSDGNSTTLTNIDSNGQKSKGSDGVSIA
jgi:hypothetical protein